MRAPSDSVGGAQRIRRDTQRTTAAAATFARPPRRRRRVWRFDAQRAPRAARSPQPADGQASRRAGEQTSRQADDRTRTLACSLPYRTPLPPLPSPLAPRPPPLAFAPSRQCAVRCRCSAVWRREARGAPILDDAPGWRPANRLRLSWSSNSPSGEIPKVDASTPMSRPIRLMRRCKTLQAGCVRKTSNALPPRLPRSGRRAHYSPCPHGLTAAKPKKGSTARDAASASAACDGPGTRQVRGSAGLGDHQATSGKATESVF